MYARYEGEKSMRFTFRRFLVATDHPPRPGALRHHSNFPGFGAMPPASGNCIFIQYAQSWAGSTTDTNHSGPRAHRVSLARTRLNTGL